MRTRILAVAAFLIFALWAAPAKAQVAGFPCVTSGNVGLQIPNIGNTTNWGYCLNYDISTIDTLLGGVGTFQLNATTPSVKGFTNWLTATTTATTITNLLQGYVGKNVRIYCGTGDVSTQIIPNGNFSMSSTWSCSSSKAISLTLINGVWIESGRWGGTGGGGGGLADPGNNGIVKRTSPNVTTTAVQSDFVALGLVPGSTTVNGHALSTSVIISASDLLTGTLPHAQLPALVSGDIPNNAANTTGNAGTATALASAPSTCGVGVAATGILANGNATGCFSPTGSPGGSAGQLQFNNSPVLGGISGWSTNGTTTITGNSTAVLNLSAMSTTNGLQLPTALSATPTADGFISVNSTVHTLVHGSNGSTLVSAVAALNNGTATSCTNQVITAVSGIAIPTCSTVTATFLPSSVVMGITNDTNVTGSISAQVLTLGWTGLLSVARGGTGVGTLTGIAKGNGTSAFSPAANTDVIVLWTGTCNSTTFLRGDGSCQTPAGSGNVSTGGTAVANQLAVWSGSTTLTNTATDVTTTHALFATAGIPAFRAIATGDLPGSVVTSITNDTNVTGSIASQVLTLGWTGTLAVARGGIGVGTLTGIAKGNGTSAFTAAASGDVIGLWTGTCNGTTFLAGNGACIAGNAGTVTSVGQTFTGGLISVSGSPITTSGTLALTVAGTSGGIVYFSSSSTWASSATLTSGQFVLGGGVGGAPTASFSIVPVANGGLGVANPTAHAVLLGEGSSATASAAPTGNGQCFMSAASLGTTTDPSFQSCPGSTITFPVTVAGTVNSGGIPYFNSTTQMSSSATLTSGNFVLGGGAGGAPTATFSVVPPANGGTGVGSPTAHSLLVAEGSSNFSLLTSPSVNGFYVCGFNVVSSAAVDPTCTIQGVPVTALTGTTDNLTSAVNVNFLTFINAAATAVNGPTLANNIAFSMENLGAGLVTYTPASGTINPLTGAGTGTATQIIPSKWFAFSYTNNTDTFIPVVATLAAYTNCNGATSAMTINTATGAFGCNTIPVISGLTTGVIPQATSATAIGNSSPQLDNGVTTANTLTYAGTAGIAAIGFFASAASNAGFFECKQGTAVGHATANTITQECPAAVTAYELVLPGTAATGIALWTNASNVVTESLLTSAAAGDLLVGTGTTWQKFAGNASGTNCLQENASGVASWAACGGGGSSALSSITAATGANTIASGNNPQTWNWAQTTASQASFTLGETTAATASGDIVLKLATLTTSTAIPLQIAQGTAGPSGSAAPSVFSIASAAAGGAASPATTGAGNAGSGIVLLTGAGSAGGSTSGNGGNGGNFTLTFGAGGTVTSGTVGLDGIAIWQQTTAATSTVSHSAPLHEFAGTFWYNPDFNTGSPPLAAASATDCWTMQDVVANGSNGTSILTLTHNGASPSGCAGSPATAEVSAPYVASAGATFTPISSASAPTVAPQGTTGAATWSYQVVACVGPNCAATSSTGSTTTGNATLTTGNWNKITWTAVTGADYYKVVRTVVATSPTSTGSICLIPAGATLECDDKALTGDSTTAPASNSTGQMTVAGTTAGFIQLGQGSDNPNGTTAIILEAPASVTSYRLQLPVGAPTNNNSVMAFSNATPSVGTFQKIQQLAILTSSYTNASTTFSTVTGTNTLQFSVEASTNYSVKCYILWQGSATTTGPKFQWTGPASPTAVAASMHSAVTATTFITASTTAFSSAMANTGTVTATTNFLAELNLGLVNGTNAGTIVLQAAANGTGTLTIQPGSYCVAQ